ncbi:MAG: hypothetical protein V1709_08550 [Planctomycetota bacterium]
MQDEKIFELFQKRKKYAEDFYRAFRKEEEVLTNYYHLKDPQHAMWKFTSLLADYADSIRSRWNNGIFAGDDFFGLGPVESNDEQSAPVMETIIKYQSSKEIALPQTLKRMLRPLSYLGNKFGKTSWDMEKQCPKVTPIENRYCLVEPTETIATCNWLLAGEEMRFSLLKDYEAEGLLQDVDNIKINGQTKSSGRTGAGNDADPLHKARSADSAKPPEDEKDPEYLIWQMWEDDHCYIIEPDSKEIISIDPHENPYKDRPKHKKPYFQLCSDPEDNINLGLSPVRKLISKNEELNEVRHLRRRFSDLYIRGIWLGKRDANIDWGKLKKEAILLADEIGEDIIKRIALGENILPSIDNEEASILRYCDRHTNIYDPQRGGGQGRNITETASGLNLIIQEGNLVFNEQIGNIQLGGIVPLVEQLVLLNQENLTLQKAAMITGKSLVGKMFNRLKKLITGKTDFDGNFDVRVISSQAFGTKEASQKILSGLTVKYAQDPTVNIRKLKEREFKAYDLDPDDVMYPEEETEIRVENQQLQIQVAQLNQALQQAQQPATPEVEEEQVV